MYKLTIRVPDLFPFLSGILCNFHISINFWNQKSITAFVWKCQMLEICSHVGLWSYYIHKKLERLVQYGTKKERFIEKNVHTIYFELKCDMINWNLANVTHLRWCLPYTAIGKFRHGPVHGGGSFLHGCTRECVPKES